MDLAVRLLAMDLQGIQVSTTEEAVQFVMKHSLEQRKDALMMVNQCMMENKDRMEDAILGWSTILGNLGQFGFNDQEAEVLRMEHEGISETAASIKAFRTQKQKNLSTLITACGGQRGVALIDVDCKRTLEVAGKNFLNDMTQLFKKSTVREGILCLNDAIVVRNQADVVGKNMRGGLSAKDAQLAAMRVKGKDKGIHLTLLAERLQGLNLTIGASGLLVVRNYTDEIFPLFDDKDTSLPPIVVLSIRTNRQDRAATTSNVEPSTPLPATL